MAEHTRTPWRIHTFRTSLSPNDDVLALHCVGKSMTGRDWTCFVETEDGASVLETYGDSAEEAITTARLVLKRVDAHDALVEAVKTAQTVIRELHDRLFPDGWFVYIAHSDEWKQIEAALALAQKESE